MACSFWITGGSGFQKTDYVVARYLPELEWHLVVNQDTAALVESLNRQLVLTMLVICVIIAVILWVITHVIRAFNRQIVELTQSVEQERRTVFEKATGQLFEDIYELDITANRPANHATEQYFESLGAPHGTPTTRRCRSSRKSRSRRSSGRGISTPSCPKTCGGPSGRAARPCGMSS